MTLVEKLKTFRNSECESMKQQFEQCGITTPLEAGFAALGAFHYRFSQLAFLDRVIYCADEEEETEESLPGLIDTCLAWAAREKSIDMEVVLAYRAYIEHHVIEKVDESA